MLSTIAQWFCSVDTQRISCDMNWKRSRFYQCYENKIYSFWKEFIFPELMTELITPLKIQQNQQNLCLDLQILKSYIVFAKHK